MKNVNELRQRLSVIFDKLEAHDIDYKTAAVLKGTAAVMISSAKTQVDYKKMIGSKTQIAFLDGK